MGPAFDRHTPAKRELLRRARTLLRTHGAVEVADNGSRTSRAATEAVRVLQDNKGTVIRYYREAAHPLMSWPRVLTVDWDGYENLWNPELLGPAIRHLRSIQVLDDMADA